MRRIVLSSLAVFFAISFSFGQTVAPAVVNTAGGSFNDPNYYFRFDWSVGEMALVDKMQSFAGVGLYIITNGLLQPYVNTPGTGNNNSTFGSEEIRVFPNPATNYVEIDFLTKQRGMVSFSLYDNIGQRIYFKSFLSYGLDRIERISLGRFAAGTYMLHIELDPDEGFVSKKGNFKIIKTN